MAKTIRVVSREADGTMRTTDYENFDRLQELHEQVGIDDCSTDLTLRGMPVFRGLIGPIPESKTVCRYESPDVFEAMTKEWTAKKTKRRRRRKSVPAPASGAMITGTAAPVATPTPTV